MKRYFWVLTTCTIFLTGCQTYRYRVVQPDSGAPPVRDQPVTVHYDPLDYRLFRDRDRLTLHVTNPTDDRIVLQGNRSFVVDPQGESHPFRDRVIGPHSYTRFLLPPIPFTYAYPDYWGWGPGWGWGWGWGYVGYGYDPFWGPWYGPGFWGPPPISYRQLRTSYDWEWKTGSARLRLIWERSGKTIEHNFEIVREPDKK